MKRTFNLTKSLLVCSLLMSAMPEAHACDVPVPTYSTKSDTLLFMWSGVTGAMQYQYVVDNSPSSPMAGTTTTMTYGMMAGLQPGQSYYLHVRTVCMSGASAWYNSPAIARVASPTGVTVIPASTSATFTWGSVMGATSYEYAVNSSITPPSAGQPEMGSSANVQSLSSSTTYYFHLRTKKGNSYSSWVNQAFTTSAPTAVTNVSGQNEFSISAYPNPVNSTVFVGVSGQSSNGRAQMVDINGKLIKDLNINGVNDVSDVAAGLYLIKYMDNSHNEVLKISKR